MEDNAKLIDQLKGKYQELKKEISRTIVGQEDVIAKVLISIFTGYCHIGDFGSEIQPDSVHAGPDAVRYYRN